MPENETNYPEPSMFGVTPAYGFYVRHASGIEFNNVETSFTKDDARPAFVLDDVTGAQFSNIKAQKAANAPMFSLKNVTDFTVNQSKNVADTRIKRAEQKQF